MQKKPGAAESVLRACKLLRAFEPSEDRLSLGELAARAGLTASTAHRLVSSLVEGGALQRVQRGQYRTLLREERKVRPRIGYAAQTTDRTFCLEVSRSLERSARAMGAELIVLNNHYTERGALRVVDELLSRGIEVGIEFQTYEEIAPLVAARFLEAGVPLIALEIPHPGTVFFGSDNMLAGLMAGRTLGRYVKEHWAGEAEEILLLVEKVAGSVPALRVTGAVSGILEEAPHLAGTPVVRLDGRGMFEASLQRVRKHLRWTPPRRTLVVGNYDPSTLGALRAFEEAGRAKYCAAVTHGAVAEGRDELRRPNTRLIGAVAFYPERYGDYVLPLALELAAGRKVAATNFMEHRLITPDNVDVFYPAG